MNRGSASSCLKGSLVSRSTVHSPVGIRLVCGLVAPFLSPDGQDAIEARWGASAQDLFSEARTQVYQSGSAGLHLALGAWIRDTPTHQTVLPVEAQTMLAGLLEYLPADVAEANTYLDAWAAEHTDNMIVKFPGEVRENTTGILASAVAVDEAWARPATEQRGPFGDARVAGFGLDLDSVAARATEDGAALFAALTLANGMELRLCSSTDGLEAAAHLLAATMTGPSEDDQAEDDQAEDERSGVERVFARVAVPGDHLTASQWVTSRRTQTRTWVPTFTLRAQLDVAAEAEQWGLGPAMVEGAPGLGMPVHGIVQSSFIEVSHTGVRAAAVTAMMFGAANAMSARYAQTLVQFAEPFAFMLVEPGKDTALFAGLYDG